MAHMACINFGCILSRLMRSWLHYSQIWGHHSTTQVPDFVNARIGGRPAIDVIGDMSWFK